jgi:hypothetical protein
MSGGSAIKFRIPGKQDRTVKVTLCVVSPRVEHRIDQLSFLVGATFPTAIRENMMNSRTCQRRDKLTPSTFLS